MAAALLPGIAGLPQFDRRLAALRMLLTDLDVLVFETLPLPPKLEAIRIRRSGPSPEEEKPPPSIPSE